MTFRTVPLASLAAVHSGGGAPQDPAAFSPSGHPFVRAGSLSKLLNGHDENSLEKIEHGVAARHGLKLFPEGTVLFAKSGMSATKGYVYRLRVPAYVVNHLAALIPHDPADSAFLARALEKFPPTSLIKDSAYPSIRLGDIEEMPINAPTEQNERRRIAAILDQADRLRRNRRETLSRLEGLVWGIFYDMFGAPDVNPNKYPIKLFRELIVDGPTNGLYKHSSAYGEGTPILRINNFYDGRVKDLDELRRVKLSPNEIRTFMLKEGDVVINRVNSREYLGKSALIPRLDESVVFESNMMRIGIDKFNLDGIFCITLLQTEFIKRQIDRSAKDAVNQSSINQTDVCSFQIIVPPIAKQHAFAARVNEISRLKLVFRSHLVQLDALFASLQHRAFCGEL